MKLQLHHSDGMNLITGHTPETVIVNGVAHADSLIVLPEHLISPWRDSSASPISWLDFEPLLTYSPKLVIYGSGMHFIFPSPEIAARFAAHGIGFEVMDTPAACRTYNVLVSEGRHVAAALVIDPAIAN